MDELKIEEYILSHIDPEPELLKRMTREANVKLLRPRMISGNIQGRLLKILTSMLMPQNILEIGTYTGYSAICIAEGAPYTSQIVIHKVHKKFAAPAQGHFFLLSFKQYLYRNYT